MKENMNDKINDDPGKPMTLAQEARRLVGSSRRGVLSTLIEDDGTPYGSLVELVALPDGDILMFLSRLAMHRRYLEADQRASIFILPETMADNALAQPRVTLVGRVEAVEKDPEYIQPYLQRHPGAGQYLNFADFQFFRFRVEKVRYIAGFGRMGWIREGTYRKAAGD